VQWDVVVLVAISSTGGITMEFTPIMGIVAMHAALTKATHVTAQGISIMLAKSRHTNANVARR